MRAVGTPYPNLFIGNTITGTIQGMMVSYATNQIIANNRFSSLTGNGIGAFHLYRSHNIQLLNNEVTSSHIGITIVSSSDNQVKGNRIAEALYGIALFDSTDNAIESNTFNKNVDNIDLVDSKNNLFIRNNFMRNQRQIYDDTVNSWSQNYWDDYAGPDNNKDGFGDIPYVVSGTSVDNSPKMEPHSEEAVPVPGLIPAEFVDTQRKFQFITEHTIWENCAKELNGYLSILSGASLTIRNCVLSAAPFGSALNNAITAVTGSGLYVYNSTLGGDGINSSFRLRAEQGSILIIKDSKINYAGDWQGAPAIQILGDNSIIENNEMEGCYHCIQIENSSNHRIVNNKMTNGLNGILGLGSSTGNIITKNSISKMFLGGISLDDFSNTEISDNIIENALFGLGLGGNSNVVSNNTFRNNITGVHGWEQGQNNYLYRNNFVDNGTFSLSIGLKPGQALDQSTGNRWDYEGIGNYWSDYTGEDADDDGIGDAPYLVSENGVDRHPLMKPSTNEIISKPTAPSGPADGTIGISYSYTTGGSSSSLGDSVQYLFDWGDGTNSGWLAVGTKTAAKSWFSAGTYSVKVQARCETDTSALSGWSGTLSITISMPSITPQSPSDNTHFGACSLYSLPIFSWTAGETFKSYEVQFSTDNNLGTPIKVKASVTQAAVTSAIWKRVLLSLGVNGGTVYWRVVGTRADKTTFKSEIRSIVIDSTDSVGNPAITSTSKNSLPTLSWENKCNIKFKVWFSGDSSFTKKHALSCTTKNPNLNGGLYTKMPTSNQWIAIRKLVGDVSGSTIYWYLESWDGLGRYNKTGVASFVLSD